MSGSHKAHGAKMFRFKCGFLWEKVELFAGCHYAGALFNPKENKYHVMAFGARHSLRMSEMGLR